MAGTSGTPLPRKLGVKEATRFRTLGAPPDFDLGVPSVASDADVILAFCRDRATLVGGLPDWFREVGPNGIVWVAWPKRASGVLTDLSEDRVREEALRIGKVDVKVCAIDRVWSGLGLVTRLRDRPTGR